MQKYVSSRSVQYICADSNKYCLLWSCFWVWVRNILKLSYLEDKTCLQFSLENTLKTLCLWQCFLIFLNKIIMTVTRISSCPDSHCNQLFCLYLSILFFSLPALPLFHTLIQSHTWLRYQMTTTRAESHAETYLWLCLCTTFSQMWCVCLHVRKCVCVLFPIIHL